MKKYLAIAVYRSFMDGVAQDSLDFQTRFFSAESEDSVREFIKGEAPGSYKNALGENVEWRLAQIMALDEYTPPEHGEEMIGFIVERKEIMDLLSQME